MLKRHRERPSSWHVIVTCMGLIYAFDFVSIWWSSLDDTLLRQDAYFWPTWIGFGLVLAWIIRFLFGELFRQSKFSRQWKSS